MRPARLLTGPPAARLAAALAAAVLLAPLAAAPAAAAPEQPEPGSPWFGPELDWEVDDALAYVDRLGTRVSLLSRPLGYPLDDAARVELRDLADESAELGAVSVVSLFPEVSLERLTPADARAFARELAALGERYGNRWLVRFAPEMNGTWYPWGQRPRAYRAAFVDLAREVHAETDAASMVWSPNYGAGYPFGAALGRVEQEPRPRAEQRLLDTNGDGRLDVRDDPYAAYYPGDRHVDWVGLSVYRFGVDARRGTNTLPGRRELEQRLDEQFGYPERVDREPFYERYAAGPDQPLLLSTAALHSPRASGPSALEVKRSWWRQVLAATEERPLIGAVAWLELSRVEPEVGTLVDWGATGRAPLAAALRRDLEGSDVDLGPVVEPTAGLDPAGGDEGEGEGDEGDEAAAQTQGGAEDAAAADDEDPGQGAEQSTAQQLGLGDGALASAALGAALGALAVLAAFVVTWRQRRKRMRPPWL